MFMTVNFREIFWWRKKQVVEKQLVYKNKLKINCFVILKKIQWISQTDLSKFWEAEIQSCFTVPEEFYYLSKVDKLENLIVYFKKISGGETEYKDSTFKD